MVIISLFQWWYSDGWLSAVSHASHRIKQSYRLFSIPILLQTLFSPWRRIMTNPGPGLDGIIRSFIDNTISRFIGFFVRFIVLLSAGVVILIVSFLSFLEIVLWLFVPPAIIGLLVMVGIG